MLFYWMYARNLRKMAIWQWVSVYFWWKLLYFLVISNREVSSAQNEHNTFYFSLCLFLEGERGKLKTYIHIKLNWLILNFFTINEHRDVVQVQYDTDTWIGEIFEIQDSTWKNLYRCRILVKKYVLIISN